MSNVKIKMIKLMVLLKFVLLFSILNVKGEHKVFPAFSVEKSSEEEEEGKVDIGESDEEKDPLNLERFQSFVVSIQANENGKRKSCSGSILTRNTVLCPAHCVCYNK